MKRFIVLNWSKQAHKIGEGWHWIVLGRLYGIFFKVNTSLAFILGQSSAVHPYMSNWASLNLHDFPSHLWNEEQVCIWCCILKFMKAVGASIVPTVTFIPKDVPTSNTELESALPTARNPSPNLLDNLEKGGFPSRPFSLLRTSPSNCEGE